MSVISKAILQITENVEKDNAFYGTITNTKTIIDENKMDKFEDVIHPNSGIRVWFEYWNKGLDIYPKEYEISVNKYAFYYFHGGIFRRFMRDSNYLFELVIRVNEDNDIDLDKDVFIYIYDLSCNNKLIDKIKIEDIKLII